jgi:hypothetical protein
MYNQTQKQLRTLSQSLLKPKLPSLDNPTKQLNNKACETCKDTETGVSLGVVYWNDVGASGVERFTLHDCPTCKGEKWIW